MTIQSISKLVFSFFILISIGACSSSSSDDGNNASENCSQLATLDVSTAASVTLGSPIELTADYLDGVLYYWTGPNGFESYYHSPQISEAKYNDRGTYTCTISKENCPDRVVSVNVDVNFPQGTPSCALTNNSAQFSGSLLLGNQTFGFSTWEPAAVGNNYEIVANGINGDMSIYMSPYWNTHDLEDGIYYTTNNISPEYFDFDKIYISNVNGGFYWQCEANKPVYVSHVGGKQRISFCGITFSGYQGGPTYYTTIKAQITQP